VAPEREGPARGGKAPAQVTGPVPFVILLETSAVSLGYGPARNRTASSMTPGSRSTR